MKKLDDWFSIEAEFDKKFTRKSKGLENKGQYMDRWFVRETTARKLKEFIKKVYINAQKEGAKEMKKRILRLRTWLPTEQGMSRSLDHTGEFILENDIEAL